MRPEFGSPPCSAHFTSGELATARATGSTASGRAAHHQAGDALGALAVGDDLERELAQQRVERLAERAARRRSPARPRTPDAPPAITNTESFVESWPSTMMRSNERSHAARQ